MSIKRSENLPFGDSDVEEEETKDDYDVIDPSLLTFATISIEPADLCKTFDLIVGKLAKEFEFCAGDVVIKLFDDIEHSFELLLAAGNKGLDALLYFTYKDDPEKRKIFTIVSKEKINQRTASNNYALASGYMKAWSMFVVTRGSHPSKSGDSPLPKFMHSQKMIPLTCADEKALADEMTMMGSLNYFPASIIMDINFEVFGKVIYQRMMMSTAGTRGLKYAKIATEVNHFSSTGDGYAVAAYEIALYTMTLKNHWKTYHPLNEQFKMENFTSFLTRAIYKSIVAADKEKFILKILDPKHKSFLKDPTFKSEDQNGRKVYPILEEPLSTVQYQALIVNLIYRLEESDPVISELNRLIQSMAPNYVKGQGKENMIVFRS